MNILDYAESQRPQRKDNEFNRLASYFGEIHPHLAGRVNLNFYPYHGMLAKAVEIALDYGYQYYIGGGRFGRPDLQQRNYYTGYLMIYDPFDQFGRIAITKEYAITYSILHELGHALTLNSINSQYGEGRRLGGLGKPRSLREQLRAIKWELETCIMQRQLSEKIGVKISDEEYFFDRNTVLGEAVSRAITGRFTEPNRVGFFPHSKNLTDEFILGLIESEAERMGLEYNQSEEMMLNRDETTGNTCFPSHMRNKKLEALNPHWPKLAMA